MRPKTPPFQPNETKEEREHKLRDFILAAIGAGEIGQDKTVIVLARSPDSPVMRALLSVSVELADCGAGAAIILAGGAVAAEDETWSIVFAGNFANEIRLTTNPRVLDGHEQLVIGNSAVWYGDTMRRDPWKRDAFATFLAGDPVAARRARATFARLWASAHSIYANPIADAMIVGAERSLPEDVAEPVAQVADATQGAEGQSLAMPAMVGTAETLEAWQPSTCH